MTQPMRYRSRYGVTLVRLTADPAHLELVRTWRNDPEISQFMAYREHITPEMQRQWFARVDSDEHYFFLVEHRGQFVGLADAKNVRREAKSCEGGQFYKKDVWGSVVPLQGSFTTIDFIFKELKLERIHSKVLRSNARAVRFNLALGYVLDPGQDDIENQSYTLTPEAFDAKTAHLQTVLAREAA